MFTLDQVNLDALFTMLKGEPGTRKSTSALSWPLPQYWISTDQKMESLALPASRWNIPWKQVHADDYSDYSSIKAKLKQFQTSCPYKTVIVDSVTSGGDNINRETIGQKVKDSTGGKKIGNIYVPGLEEYNAEASAFQELMAMLKDINKYHKVNIIVIAHVVGQRVNRPDQKLLTHHSRVIITGGDKISGKIASYMTEVYHFNVETEFNVDSGEGKFGIYTQHTSADYARTSLPLERKILFNDKPLYDTWIRPAIEKLKQERKQSVDSQTSSSQSPQTPTKFTS